MSGNWASLRKKRAILSMSAPAFFFGKVRRTIPNNSHHFPDRPTRAPLPRFPFAMSNPLIRVVHTAHGFLSARTSFFVVVVAMLFIGIQKARGKMPHPGSRFVGRGEFIGAMFMMMPDAMMQGFGKIAGACVILAVMGGMVAIKPKALVTEVFFITCASKVLAANWGAQPGHKFLTDALSWETAMAFSVGQGLFMGVCLRMLGGGKKHGAKKSDKKRTKRA